VEQHWSGEGVGYGEGINQLLARSTAKTCVVATDDVVLDRRCIERVAAELDEHPRAVVVGCALVGSDGRVNAYGLRLTEDWLGINVDRGRSWDDFASAAPRGSAPYLGPSGALFALNREEWGRLGGGERRGNAPRAFWRAVRDGLFTELPTDVSAYLRGCEGRSLPRWCFASLRDQLRNPVA